MSCALPRNSAKEWLGIEKRTKDLMYLNLIATSPSPQTSARNLDTFTIPCQIMAVAIFMARYAKCATYPVNNLWDLVSKDDGIVRWMLNAEANCDWVKDYGILLCVEYGLRTGRRHAGEQAIMGFINEFGPPIGAEPEGFINRAIDETFDFRYVNDTHMAYRHYMNAKWTTCKHHLSWGDRMPPAWYIEEQIKKGTADYAAGKEV